MIQPHAQKKIMKMTLRHHFLIGGRKLQDTITLFQLRLMSYISISRMSNTKRGYNFDLEFS